MSDHNKVNNIGALSFDSEHRLRAENLSFDIDVWYPKLKQFTFESIFIPLKREEAQSIIAFHDYSWRNPSKVLTLKDIDILHNLESCIDQALLQLCIGNCESDSHEAFIRLCGRSPKDGEPLDCSQIFQQYEFKLAELGYQGYDVTQANTKMIACSLVPLLKIKKGADAMSPILTSE